LRSISSKAVLDALRLPVIGEAASHAPQQPQLAISLAQQQSTTFGGEPASLELRHNLPRKTSFKRKRVSLHSVIEKVALPGILTTLGQRSYARESGLFFISNYDSFPIRREICWLAWISTANS
jgi:hypothetical protein